MDDSIKTVVLAWARRHGKDDIAMHATAIKAMKRPGNYYHCLPEYGQARKAIWEARNPHTGKIRWQEVFPSEIISKVDNQSMMITLVNGSTWQLIGSDKVDSLMGTTPAGIVFSEAALSKPETYAFFRPILLENKGWSIHISSVRGKNHFYDLYRAYQGREDSFVQRISAEDTDVFSEEELEAERQIYIRTYGESIGNSLFNQEYLSSWDSATIGSVFGQELTNLEKEGRATPLAYDRRFPVDTSWDIGVGDETVILFWQTVGNVERLIDWYAASDTGLAHYAEVLKEKGYVYRHHYGPHDIAVREWGANGVSRLTQAKRLGINFTVTPNIAKLDSIALASDMLTRTVINVSDHKVGPNEDCELVLSTLKEYKFQYDKTRKVFSRNPIHNFASHYADALMVKAFHASVNPHAIKASGPMDTSPVPESQQFDETRLRDILRKKPRVKGAWG